MSNETKEKGQNFIQGAAVLSICTIIVKIVSALYKIPLNNVIGKEGYTYFLQTYNIYALLLIISTAGLPVAVSHLIAEARAKNDYGELKRINRASLFLFTGLGVVGCLIMVVFAQPLATLMGVEDCAVTFRALGPAVLFVCVTSAFRGYFQGLKNMTPTGISEVIEAVIKLVLGLFLAYMIQRLTGNLVNAVAGAILGVTVGAAFAFIYILAEYWRTAATLPNENLTLTQETNGATLKRLLSFAVPITLSASGLQIFDLIDSAMVMHRLRYAVGLSYEDAKSLRGLYGTAQTLFGLPSAFVTPFVATLMPGLTDLLARDDKKGAKKLASDEIRIMAMIILPCGVGLGVLGKPIMQLLYSSYTEEDCTVAGALLSIISIAVILNALVLMLNSTLQAYKHVYLPIFNMVAGGVVKVVVNFILVGMPSVNIYGAPIGTVLCFLTITILDVITLKRTMKHPPRVLSLMKKTILASAVMGVCAWGSNYLLLRIVSARIACVGAIAVGVAVYAVMVLCLKMIDYEDCRLLPKGEKIAKILHIQPNT